MWRADLDRPQAELDRLAASLSEEERQRAARYVFERDARRFMVARGILRTVLGRYLQSSAATIRFCYSIQGKPALASGSAPCFNVAHSHELALFVLARGRPVGIDVEKYRPLDNAEGIARRFFSPPEIKVLLATEPEERTRRFFQIWTHKEAIVKALGEGLSHPLDAFDVVLDDGRSAPMVHFAGEEPAGGRWQLRDLTPSTDYAAALAVAGVGWQLRCWEFTLEGA